MRQIYIIIFCVLFLSACGSTTEDSYLFNSGNEKFQNADYNGAIADYDKAIELNHENADYYNARGIAKNKIGDFESSLNDQRKAIEINPEKPEYYYYQGLAYFNLRAYILAVKDYETFLDKGGNPNPDEYYNQAIELSKDSKQEPLIIWDDPIINNKIYNTDNIIIRAFVISGTKVEITLYVDDIVYQDRGLEIIPAEENYIEYSKKIKIQTINKPVTIKLIAKNIIGSTMVDRNIIVKNEYAPRLALVIGNSNYQNGINGLVNPVNDADSITNILKSNGFEVREYTDCSYEKMQRVITDFNAELKNYKTGLFYYAGHGVQYQESNYLIPIDANITTISDIAVKSVNIDKILSGMREANTDVNIVILDACRDNPFGSYTKGLIPLSSSKLPKETIIAYAAGANQTASDNPSGKNGLFTGELINFIGNPNMTIEEVLKKTRQSIKDKTNNTQTPEDTSNMTNNFCFKINYN